MIHYEPRPKTQTNRTNPSPVKSCRAGGCMFHFETFSHKRLNVWYNVISGLPGTDPLGTADTLARLPLPLLFKAKV